MNNYALYKKLQHKFVEKYDLTLKTGIGISF